MSIQRISSSDLSDISQTMLLTLYMRSLESQRTDGMISHPLYQEMVSQIDYDFSKWDNYEDLQVYLAVRTLLFDQLISEFIADNPNGCVCNIASGLGIGFTLAENSNVTWLDIDLPPVIQLRQKLIGNKKNVHAIACSVWDFDWINHIAKDTPLLIVIEGLLLYFEEADVKRLFLSLIDRLPSFQITFDSISQTTLEQEQRSATYLDFTKTPYRWGINDIQEIEEWHPSILVEQELYPFEHFGQRCPANIKELLENQPMAERMNRIALIQRKTSTI